MKIAHVIYTMERGGAERLVALMCRMQRERGDAPAIHCLHAVGAFGEELAAEGFPVVLHGPAGLPHYFISLYREFRRYRPDVVHCHNATPTIAGAPAARIAGVPCVVATRHQLVAPPHNWRRELKFALASRFCHWNVAVCEATRRNLLNSGLAPERSTVTIYNGAEGPRRLEEQRAGSYSAAGGFTFVHVGRLVPEKDQRTLLKAFAMAQKIRPELRLQIVGGGVLQQELLSLARELGLNGNFEFCGEQRDVAPFLLNADAFVMSSVSEGLPVSLIEAMSAGLPLIVTDAGGMGEVVKLARAGIIVPPGSQEALAAAMVEAAANPRKTEQLAASSRAAYLAYFRPEAMLDGYNRLYASALREAHA
ncbi:MAG: glycosyltransferase [Acidobacteria bacterium]|nr:glycosyltransferase [Acidobacteriota bacterium]